MLVTTAFVASAAGCVHGSVYSAIKRGDLSAVYGAAGQVLVTRESLDRWLTKRFYRSGGTDDPDKITLSQARGLAECGQGAITRAFDLGELTRHTNPEGYPILDRAEFMHWWKARPPHRHHLPQDVTYYDSREIAKMVGIKSQSVNRAIGLGELPATLCIGRRKWEHRVAEPDLQAWLLRRAEKFPQVPMRGEVISIKEACRRYAIGPIVLRHAIRLKRVPASKQLNASGDTVHVVGCLDVEDFLRWRAEGNPDHWSVSRICAALGLGLETVRCALVEGRLSFLIERHRTDRPRRVVEVAALLDWIERERPPHRLEAAHLHPLAGPEEAVELSQTSPSVVSDAIAGGQLVRLGASLTRYSLDNWLVQLGQPTSWEREAWLSVTKAAQVAAVESATVNQWIRSRRVCSLRSGGRYLVQRASLEDHLKLRAGHGLLTCEEAAQQFGVARIRLVRAAQGLRLHSHWRGRRRYLQASEVEQWLATRKQHGHQPVPPPEAFLPTYSVLEACQSFSLSEGVLREALRCGRLRSRKDANGLYTLGGPDLRNWLVFLFEFHGGTGDPRRLSLRQAAGSLQWSVARVRELIFTGVLSRHYNGAGRLILDRTEFESWRQNRGCLAQHYEVRPRLPVGPPWLPLAEAAQAAALKPERLFSAIDRKRIKARVEGNMTWVERQSLELWLARRFYLRGGTDEPAQISLTEAASLAHCTHSRISRALRLGKLTRHQNPEGVTTLDRAEFLKLIEEFRAPMPTAGPGSRAPSL